MRDFFTPAANMNIIKIVMMKERKSGGCPGKTKRRKKVVFDLLKRKEFPSRIKNDIRAALLRNNDQIIIKRFAFFYFSFSVEIDYVRLSGDGLGVNCLSSSVAI